MTLLKNTENEIFKPDSFAHVAFQNDLVGHIILSHESSLLTANRRMFEYFNLSLYDISNLKFGNAFRCINAMNTICGMSDKCSDCQIIKLLSRILYSDEKADGFTCNYTFSLNGETETRWYRIYGNTFYFQKYKYAVITFIDISDEQNKISNIEELLKLDLATGVKNKYSLMDSITEQLTELSQGNHFVIAMIDFDCFKDINDSYGHIMGDNVLIEFSNIILQNILPNDIVGRYGGEEFVILFNNLTLKQAVSVLQKTHKELKLVFQDIIVQDVTFSAGAMLVDDTFANEYKPTDIISKVDKLLYRAKKNGRCRLITTLGEYIFN